MNETNKKSENTAGLLPVVSALVGNSLVVIIKFIGFAVSGSGVMFSEAIHSFADTSNQALLLIGIERSKKKADTEYSYGYGQERFLWALISACGIFFVGSGITIYHGINSLLHIEPVTLNLLVFVILAISFIFEGTTFLIAIRELKERNKGEFKKCLKNGDPTTLAVIFEDGVAVLGIVIAFLCILLTKFTGSLYWDSFGSIIIGVLLGVVAIVLINKNRGYLIGKNIPEDMKERIIEIMEADPMIEKVLDFKSSILDIGQYQIKCEVEFNGHLLIKELCRNESLKSEYETIKNDYDYFLKFCVNYVDRVPRLVGNKIDEIEAKIKKEIPELRHIDIEIN